MRFVTAWSRRDGNAAARLGAAGAAAASPRRRARLTAAVIAAAALGVASARPVAADPATLDVRDPEHRFQLAIPSGWDRVAVDANSTGILLGYRDPSTGRAFSIARVDVANPDAWRGSKPFFDHIEQGLADSVPGYRRRRRRLHKLDQVPVLDLEFRRRRGSKTEAISMRFLFFRNYSLSLTVVAPAASARRGTEALVRSFAPYLTRHDTAP